ncbi:MAG: Dabb family protein [Balneolaceae bacterium]
MIRHIVMWKLKDQASGATKEKNAEKLKLILEGLRTNIDEIKAVEVGIQINPDHDDSLDVVLICDFETELDFQMYTRNTHHKKAVKFISEVAEQRFYVDYKVDI